MIWPLYQRRHKRNQQLNQLTDEVIELIAKYQFAQQQIEEQNNQLVQNILGLDELLFGDLIMQQYEALLELIKHVSKSFKGSRSVITSWFGGRNKKKTKSRKKRKWIAKNWRHAKTSRHPKFHRFRHELSQAYRQPA